VLTWQRYTIADAEFWVSNHLTAQSQLLPLTTIPTRAKAFFSQETPFPLDAIRHNGKFIGCCSLTPRLADDQVAELGYYLHPAHHGKGIMFAAGIKLLEYAREEFGVKRIYSSVDCKNEVSAKVIEKLARATAVGEIKKSEAMLTWPVEKMVERSGVESLSLIWEWSIDV
jgi:RimJ/RimL family protein N-acetyltransferase